MRKLLIPCRPASMLLTFLAMVIFSLGGCGGDGGGGISGTTPSTLTSLSIDGPSSMSEYGTAKYTATESWSDGSTTSVTPTWSVSSQVAEINTEGTLYCLVELASDQTVTITATYTYGGITKTASMDVTINDETTIPFTDQELLGKVFFQEYADVGYESFLYILNSDSSLDLYATFALPRGDTSYYRTGTWSNDPDGLFLDFRLATDGPYTVRRVSDSPTEMEVSIYEYVWGTHYETWEKTVPVDPAKLPGTYAGSDGYTWVFNANGTGTVSIFGGIIFTWSVDANGVLRMPSSTGYTMSFYARATSQSTATEYTVLKAAFPEHNTSTGSFYAYYGGIELTRQ